MVKKSEEIKHAPNTLYEFIPNEDTITASNIVELAKIIRIGVNGDVVKKLSPELQKHFKEVA